LPDHETKEKHASDIGTGLYNVFHHSPGSPLPLIQEDTTVPALLWRRVRQELLVDRNKGWFSGPIAAHAIETEQSPEYADGVKNGQRAVGYRVEGR
jgi:hypothetical protein